MTDTTHLSDEQWSQIRQAVHDEALRARTAASFLPLFGPLPADTQAVPVNVLETQLNEPGTQMQLAVNDFDMMRLSTVSVNVLVKNAQLADPELTSALMMFRRAAEIVSRMEDAIIFNGQDGVGQPPKKKLGADRIPPVYKISGGGNYAGLIKTGESNGFKTKPGSSDPDTLGPEVFKAIVKAISNIEGAGYGGPFACVMGDNLFTAITTPMANSMVLPRDSILPFLDGPLIRSSAVPQNTAVVIGLLGNPVELVVPSDISVSFLQTTPDGENVFRVQQKFVLRVKEEMAVSTISLN